MWYASYIRPRSTGKDICPRDKVSARESTRDFLKSLYKTTV